jgi:AraC-like DNA-binding protein
MRHPGPAARVGALFPLVTAKECHDVELQCEEALLLLLASVLRPQQPDHGEKRFPSAIFRARALIDDDPAASVTLSDLAGESGLSRFQVVRSFARVTGMTPHAYLLQRRIHLARQLIAGGQSLAEAALASGFADQSHMTRIFVRAYGVSPGAYAAAVI